MPQMQLSLLLREQRNSDMEYSIRTACDNDKAAINRLFLSMLDSINEDKPDPKYDIPGYSDSFFNEYIHGRFARIFTAESAGAVVGYIACKQISSLCGNDFIYVEDFSIDERFRNRGIGSSLLDTAENYTRECSFESIQLHCEVTNINAHRFYVRHGYDDVIVEGTRIRMEKILN